VFGEMLTFQSLLDRDGPGARKAMLAGKVEDMLNTVVRQIAFYRFEIAHARRAARRRTDARRDRRDLDGGAAREPGAGLHASTTEYKHYWSYIPHFIHTPFYVYAYAFGDCLVNSLYAVYQASRGLSEKYLDMLRAGGTKRHKELLAPFGLDASDPAFWDKGLGVISGFIDELEKL
jgi:oligoendopeptidase F